ncbi:MAG: inositol monophosphatase family protein [Hyphomicrobium sp.]
MPIQDFDKLTRALLPAVLEAGRAELRHFRTGVAVTVKADASPVTAADHEAEAILLLALETLAPDVPVIAEELAAAGRLPPPQGTFFLVDALDGTRQFIKGKPEFSVNIGLVRNNVPVFGLIYVPPSGQLFFTAADGRAYGGVVMAEAPVDLQALALRPLAARLPDADNLVAFNSRTAGGACTDFLSLLDVREAKPVGSSVKFCLLADGQGDIYARFGPTYEWDTAAGQAILEAAGGSVMTEDGQRLTYGKVTDAYLNPNFVAWGRKPLVRAFGTEGKGAKSAMGS